MAESGRERQGPHRARDVARRRACRPDEGRDPPRRDVGEHGDRARDARGLEGYRVTLCVPANLSTERKRTLKAFGAELVFTPATEGTDGAQRRAKAVAASEPRKYRYLDQYNNEANWQAHFESTGPEIWEQTAGTITHFVACLGTTGTFVGVGRYLRKMNRTVRLVGVQPDSPLHGLEGVKHLETSLVPGIWEPSP